MKNKSLLFAASFIFTCFGLSAQDFYFSQYEHVPLNINPALISSEKEIKLSLHYHQNELWKDLDMKNLQMSAIYPLNLVKNSRMPQALGLSMIYNNTGKDGLVSCSGGNLAFSQGITINRWSQLSAGLQASYYFYNNSNPGNYTTGNQWVYGSGFDPGRGIEENINYENINLYTINAGVNWHLTDGSNSKGNFGCSLYQINKPTFSLLDESNSLETKFIIHGNYRIFKLKSLSISPRALWVNQNNNLISFGSLFNYSFKSDNPFLLIRDCNLQLGLDYRNNHSFITSLSIEQSRYLVGISYSFGLNKSMVYSNLGTNIEICLAFKFRKANKQSIKQSEYRIGETRLVFDKGSYKDKAIQYYNENDTISGDNPNNIIVTGEKYKVQLRQDFKFKFNDATLTPESQLYLDDLAKMLKQNQGLKVEVVGHTDDIGTEEANRIISEKRAQIVINYLESKGIKSDRLKLTAKGKSEPVAPNSTEENKAKNRRVEFIIYSE